MTIGERLKVERKRLKLTQPRFAELGGVTRDAQMNYEKGNRAPNSAYLAKVAESGVDVLYVITGEPNSDMPGATLLNDKQQKLVANYDAATEENKKIIEGVARLAAQQSSPRP